jgi:glycosyltransferase involved in cell wall biosynthesis
MIRVVLLAPTLLPGGAERQMLYLASGLPRDRFDVRFVLMAERGPLATEAERQGLRVDVLGLSTSACRKARPSCVRSIASAYTFAGLLRPLVRVPVLLAGRRSLPDVQRTRTRSRELARGVAMRRVDAVVANSQAAADLAVSEEGLDPGKVHVIRNAVLPASTDPGDRARLRQRWGVRDDQLLIGCVASLREGKGHPMLIDVVARLRQSDDRVRAVFVGAGRTRPQLETAIAAQGLDGVITIDSDIHDARQVPCAFDISVQASDTEGLPNAVLEAASAGTAIVATSVGGTPEVIDNEVDGLLVPRRDADALVKAITRLLDDGELRGRLGRAAAERSREFTAGALVERTSALYEELLRIRHPS